MAPLTQPTGCFRKPTIHPGTIAYFKGEHLQYKVFQNEPEKTGE